MNLTLQFMRVFVISCLGILVMLMSVNPAVQAEEPISKSNATDTVRQAEADPFEPNDDSSQATPLSSGVAQVHSIAPAGDDDWLTFTLDTPSGITLETSGTSGDTVMTLYDADLNQIAYNDDYYSLFSLIERTCGSGELAAGTYYVEISEYNDGFDTIPEYVISLTTASCVSETGELTISKRGPETVVTGEQMTYTLTAQNYNLNPATQLSISDSLPANTTFVRASDGGMVNSEGVVVWSNLGDLASGAQRQVQLTVAVADTVTTSRQVLPAQDEKLDETMLSKRQATPRIVGGVEAEPGAWPWQVALVSSWASSALAGQFCGGSLIDEEWVLTAAHCVEGTDFGDIDVVVGQHRLSDSDGQRIPATWWVMHPDYNDYTLDSDIALIRLAYPATLNDSVQLVDYVTPDDTALFAPGVIATVTGWGARDPIFGDSPDALHQVSLPLVSNEVCNASYGGDITNTMICAGPEEGGQDSCYGDSGGPLVVPNGTGGYQQAGIVSWGSGCAEAGYYGVYARVAVFADWIAETMTQAAPTNLVINRDYFAEASNVARVTGSNVVVTEILPPPPEPDAYEPNDDSNQATPLNSDETQTHSIVPVGDVDWLTFELTAPAAVTLQTSGNSGDTVMRLYDADLNQIGYSDDYYGLFSFIETDCDISSLQAGRYYAAINEYGSNNLIAAYNIDLTTTACPLPILTTTRSVELTAGSVVSQTLQIGGVEYDSLNSEITTNADWLTVSLTTETPAELLVTLDTLGLAAGEYEGRIQMQSSLGKIVVIITLTVTPAEPAALTLIGQSAMVSHTFAFTGDLGSFYLTPTHTVMFSDLQPQQYTIRQHTTSDEAAWHMADVACMDAAGQPSPTTMTLNRQQTTITLRNQPLTCTLVSEMGAIEVQHVYLPLVVR